MAAAKPLSTTLAELKNLARTRHHRRPRPAETLAALLRLVSGCRLLAVEERDGGIVFRLTGDADRQGVFTLHCHLDTTTRTRLTAAEAAVAELLCEGRTRAQIARVRGVSENTVKSQIRQVFRKLDVDTRVALVRRWYR